jgi:hypothetical protein
VRGLPFLLSACLLRVASPAAADTEAGPSACTQEASVSWNVDHDDLAVTGATVEVRGCPDGEPIGLQVITDDRGEVPDGYLVEPTVDQRATFDLTSYGLTVEPTRGVRVALAIDGTEIGGEVDGEVVEREDERDDPLAADGPDRDEPQVHPGLVERDDARQVTAIDRPPPGSGVLPFTGTSALLLLGLALGLVFAGVGLLSPRRRAARGAAGGHPGPAGPWRRQG